MLQNIVGYSKYSTKTYTLKQVNENNDFINFSLPCDCFTTKTKEIQTSTEVTLTPYVPSIINKKINSSALTILFISTLDPSYLDTFNSSVAIEIVGINTLNEEVTETFAFFIDEEITTSYEYLYLRQISILGAYSPISIVVYPFILKHSIVWENSLVDRIELDAYLATVKVDTTNKDLVFSRVMQSNIDYPWYQDPVKKLRLSGTGTEAIVDYYFEEEKRLLYVVTDASKLYVYHLIIPKEYTDTLDNLKEGRQLLNIEYVENSIEETYTFRLFPNTETADVDLIDVYINDEVYQRNIIIDMLMYSTETNKVEIPFSSLFANGNIATVKFVSFGEETSVMPVFVDNNPLTPLYLKTLTDITQYTEPTNLVLSADSSSLEDYPIVTQAITVTQNSFFYKEKRSGNIFIDGCELKHIYDTFYFNEADGTIITSDTITALVNP
jgi:hypothetical protein